jgi:hypothetical protein
MKSDELYILYVRYQPLFNLTRQKPNQIYTLSFQKKKLNYETMLLKCLLYCQNRTHRYTTRDFSIFICFKEIHSSHLKSPSCQTESQQECEMLQFVSWGYESVIRCYHFLIVMLTLHFIRIPRTPLKSRLHSIPGNLLVDSIFSVILLANHSPTYGL